MARQLATSIEDLYTLKPKVIWKQFKSEHFSFWMICAYLFVEYVRPQSIIPALDFLPWAEVFVLLALVGMFMDPKRKWVSDPANKWMLAYLSVVLISSWLAFRPDISLSHLNLFYTWVLIYFLIINIVNTPARFFIFLAIFLLASFKISLSLAIIWAKRGFSFATWGLQGPPGFFQNSGELAIQMSVFFPISYVIASELKPYVSRKIYMLLMLMPVTAAMTILGSSSRGGQIALAIQILLMFWRKIYRPKVFFGVAIVAIALYALIPQQQKDRFTDIGNDKTSQQRLLYWEHGIEMIREHPFLGVGYFNFAPYYEAYFRYDMLYTRAQLPHNIFIQVGTDVGLIGFLIFFMLIYRTIKTNIRTIQFCVKNDMQEIFRRLAWSLNLAILGFLVAGQFVTVTYYPFIWINLSLTVALHWATLKNWRVEQRGQSKIKRPVVNRPLR